LAELKAKAKKITEEAEINFLKEKNKLELEKKEKLKDLEITKARELAQIESSKF
jgi:hypothetical protein